MMDKETIKECLKIDIYRWLPVFLVIFALFLFLYLRFKSKLTYFDALTWWRYPLLTSIINVFLAFIIPTFGAIFLGMYAGAKFKKGNKLLLIIWIIYFVAYVGWLLFLAQSLVFW